MEQRSDPSLSSIFRDPVALFATFMYYGHISFTIFPFCGTSYFTLCCLCHCDHRTKRLLSYELLLFQARTILAARERETFEPIQMMEGLIVYLLRHLLNWLVWICVLRISVNRKVLIFCGGNTSSSCSHPTAQSTFMFSQASLKPVVTAIYEITTILHSR